MIAASALWRFPVPFGGVIAVGPFVTVLAILVILAIGPRVIAKSPELRQQILSQLLILVTQGSLAIIYPIFNAIFERLSGIPQTISIVLMPVIKFFTKQIIASAAGNLHEYVGPVVVFSVDLFNVFYIAICMQAATSTLTTLLFIATDSIHVILALRAILHQASADSEFGTSKTLDAAESTFFFEQLPVMVRSIFRDPNTSKPRPIRVFAPFPLPLSDESIAFINGLARTKRGVDFSAPFK
ncbi:hypothetical protein PHYBOEH_001141 [Phytophthora boehmeriae]|uniref:Uncharacterized protein n=1 Tax=Phytophthora boehmeriae TaxID=109152 RepID=A0A8T1WSX8_9STRA|nr:hypothetical protein PHYBOEH_001141 [Phytophthora boehmeriae]